MTYEKFLQLSDSIGGDVTIAELEAMGLPDEFIPDIEIDLDIGDDFELVEFEDIPEEELDSLKLMNVSPNTYKIKCLNEDYELLRSMLELRDGRKH